MVPVLGRKRPASGTIQWSTVANQTPPGPYYFPHFYGLTAFYLRPVSITKAELHTLSMLRQQAGALHKSWPLSPPNIAGLPGTVHFLFAVQHGWVSQAASPAAFKSRL